MHNQSTALQLVHSVRLSAAHAALAHSRTLAAVVRDRVRGERLQAIAKRHGLGYNDVLELVEEDAAARVAKARMDGYRDGLAAARFHPLPPSVAQRRAA